MASSVIHICVADEINKVLNRDKRSFLIGSIAPDLAKELGRNKVLSHFQDNDDDIPNMKKFLLKYYDNFDDDFVLGYYVHIYTDYLWFKYFKPDFMENGVVYKLDGTKESFNLLKETEVFHKYFYSDYTNLNVQLIDKYELELKIFYEEIPKFRNIIEEIPMDKIKMIVDKTGMIIEDSKRSKPYILNLNLVDKFIKLAVEVILDDLRELKVIEK
jgi:hypothetical protein